MAREVLCLVIEAHCCGRRPLECCSQQLLGVLKIGLRKGSITKCLFIRCSTVVQSISMEAVELGIITLHTNFVAAFVICDVCQKIPEAVLTLLPPNCRQLCLGSCLRLLCSNSRQN